jgi:hypothetical protein
MYMLTFIAVLAAVTIGLGSEPVYGPEGIVAMKSPVTAVDIALEPDATMIRRANALNARLLKAYPKGYALDATHQPHITMLQRFVRTVDLDNVYAAVEKITAREHVAAWKLRAFKISYVVWNGLGVTVIEVKPTSQLLVVQQQLIDAISPYTEGTASVAAFATTPEEPDINSSTIDYVAAFVPASTGKKYVPHVTVGVAPKAFLDRLVAETFDSFTFSPLAVSVYQLGNYGTARKRLKTWNFKP